MSGGWAFFFFLSLLRTEDFLTEGVFRTQGQKMELLPYISLFEKINCNFMNSTGNP